MPCAGLSAHSTPGLPTIWTMPLIPSVMNHSTITGPNTVLTRAVPKRWKKKRPMMMITVIGTTQLASCGSTTSTPSTADRTEIAGVMIASPKNSAAPITPIATIQPVRLVKVERTSDISDSTPPSPLLSARVTKNTYLIDTVMVSAQAIRDSSPKTSPVTSRPLLPSA